MAMHPKMWICRRTSSTVVGIEVAFDDDEQAAEFNESLVSLCWDHMRRTKVPYEYETPWC